jgi:hypothetical protein
MVHVVDRTLVFARRPVAEKQLFAGQMVCPKLSIRAGQIGLKNRPTDRAASQTLPISGEEQLGNSQLT